MGQNTGSCCGGGPTTADTQSQNVNLTTRPEQSAEAIGYCQVMGGTPVLKVEAEAKGLFRDYEGERYWFCCAGCGPAFDADPAKYAYAR